ncbi:META domain-containing protein [Paraburkholderia sp. J12]|uniref:META domain-containing protein n=1 Tax=Paraburkholderia sp. J12 TaxID=2805432 RepID=UPI002ABE5314|nr:META domain-containing protein [Paraburkholderia sp. J12]
MAPLAAALMLAACKMPVHHDSSAPPPDPYTPAATQLLDNTQWQLVQWKQADGTLRAVPGAADAAVADDAASSPAAAAPVASPNGRPITLDLSTATGQRRASGFSGCNRYIGTYRLKDGLLSFGPLAGTRMACAGAGGDIEGAYLDALSHIARTGVQMHEPQALLLILEDGDRLTFTHPPADANAAQPGQ